MIDESAEAGYDNPPESGASGQLYNLSDDPREQDNSYHDEPEIVAKMKRKLDQVKADLIKPNKINKYKIDLWSTTHITR